MDSKHGVETLSELQIWIEGKFALIAQAQDTSHADLTIIRAKQHDLSNDVHVILAMNLPEKLSRLEDADKQHEINIEKFMKESAERKGALAVLKLAYGVFGVIIGYFVSLFPMFHKGS